MTAKTYIITLRSIVYSILYTGLILRMIRTYQEGQATENYPTKEKIKRLFKVGIIGTCMVELIGIIAKYYE